MSDTSRATIEAADVTPDFIRRRVPVLRVVEVRDHGELVGGFLSRQELEHYRNLVSREVEVFRAGEFPEDIVSALEDSRSQYGVGAD
jgi:hypothetical protein